MSSLSLDELRARIKQQQQLNEPYPTAPNRQVVVTKEGQVKMGEDVAGDQPVTQLQQSTFAECSYINKFN